VRLQRSGQRIERPPLIVVGALTCRNGPDVSANANFSVHVCADQATCTANKCGGTRFAPPMGAAFIALVDQRLAARPGWPAGVSAERVRQRFGHDGLRPGDRLDRAIPFRFPPFPANVLHLGHSSLRSRNKR
jgi:hypothetical protein